MDVENNIDENIKEMLQSEDLSQQIEAINILLTENVDEDSVRYIAGLINDKDKGVRNAAANFLIMNNHPSIPELVINSTGSEDISIRNLAGEILLGKGIASVKPIIKELERCTDDDNIKFLVDVVGLIGDIEPEDKLIEILKVNQNDNVIVACIEALGNIHSEKGVDTILPFYEKNEVFKPVVVESVGKIGNKKSLDFILSKFDDEEDLIKFTIIESLGEIGDEVTFYILLSKINEVGGALVWPLLEAIYKLKTRFDLDVPFDEKIKKCVLDTIMNSDPKYQIVAAHLVTVFEDPEILFACLQIFGVDPELDEVLRNKFLENKDIIIPHLSQIIKNTTRNLLSVLNLFQEIHYVDPYSINGLDEIEKHKLAQSLSDCLNDSDEMVRITAAELLFRIHPETAFLFLDMLSNDENMWNRIKLLDLLAEYEHPETAKVIKELCNDPEEMVADKAKEILSQFNHSN